jgi:hypothetical protein
MLTLEKRAIADPTRHSRLSKGGGIGDPTAHHPFLIGNGANILNILVAYANKISLYAKWDSRLHTSIPVEAAVNK